MRLKQKDQKRFTNCGVACSVSFCTVVYFIFNSLNSIFNLLNNSVILITLYISLLLIYYIERLFFDQIQICITILYVCMYVDIILTNSNLGRVLMPLILLKCGHQPVLPALTGRRCRMTYFYFWAELVLNLHSTVLPSTANQTIELFQVDVFLSGCQRACWGKEGKKNGNMVLNLRLQPTAG